MPRLRILPPFKPSGLELSAEVLQCAGKIAGPLTPLAPCAEQCRGQRKIRQRLFATFVDESSQCVFLFEVGCRRFVDDRWGAQSFTLIIKAPRDHPSQDAGPFAFQGRLKIGIPLIVFDGHAEGNEIESSAGRLVNVTQARFVIACDHQCELWDEGGEVLAHETGGDRIAASKRFDFRLGPALAILGLLRDDQALAAQFGELGRVALVPMCDESVHRGDTRVI